MKFFDPMKFNFTDSVVNKIVSLVQASSFTCAEPNANWQKHKLLPIDIRFGTCKFRRLNRALEWLKSQTAVSPLLWFREYLGRVHKAKVVRIGFRIFMSSEGNEAQRTTTFCFSRSPSMSSESPSTIFSVFIMSDNVFSQSCSSDTALSNFGHGDARSISKNKTSQKRNI